MLSILYKLISIFYTTSSTTPSDEVVDDDTIVNGINISIPTGKSDDLIFVESTSLTTKKVYINDDYINSKVDEKNINNTDNNIDLDTGNNSLEIVKGTKQNDSKIKKIINYHENVKKEKEYDRETLYDISKNIINYHENVKKEKEYDSKTLYKIQKTEKGFNTEALCKQKKKRKRNRNRNRNRNKGRKGRKKQRKY